jgi:amino acid transporter
MNIIRSGAIMAVYVFIVIILYMVISSPFDDIMTSFSDLDLANSDAEVESGISYGRIVFDIIFALAVLIPIIWFIFMCFSREPDWREY